LKKEGSDKLGSEPGAILLVL